MNFKKLKKTFSPQKDLTDCGVGCLQSLVRYYGGNISLEELREKSGTSKTGTTLLGLYQCANSIGFNAEGFEAEINALMVQEQPLILHVIIEQKYEHYVICYSYNHNGNSQFLIGDPAKGLVYWTREELEKIWVSKACLTLKPNENFQKSKKTNSEKKQWLKNLIKYDQKLIYINLLLGFLIYILGISFTIFNQILIDFILPKKGIFLLISSLFYLFLILIIKQFLVFLRGYYTIEQSKNFNLRINKEFFYSLLRLPKFFFDSRKIGDFVARLNDTQRIQNVIKYLITNTAIDILGVVISIGFLFYYSWKLALICLMVSPVIFYIIFRFNKKIIKAQKNVMQAYSMNEANYIDSIRGIDIIKGFSKQDLFLKRNLSVFGNFQAKIFELGKLNLKITLYSGLALVFFLLTILSFSSYNVLNNEIKVGELMAIIGISSSLLSSITNLALVSIPIQEAKVAFDRMFEYSSIPKEKTEGLEVSDIQSIEVKNLDFRFNGRSKLLNGVSLKLEKGKITCLLGESGSGKTTLTEILQKNYFPENGRIVINQKIDLTEISITNWRNHVSVVPQNIQLFNGTVLENIILDETLNEQKLQKVISLGFDKFLQSLPQNILTLVGEEGINLSGGQKQLLGWMRALYHDFQVLILDEPTSSLDNENRKFIYQLIENLKKEKIIFIISHHLEDLKNISEHIFIIKNTEIMKASIFN